MKNKKGLINSKKFNLESIILNRKLEEINNKKKELRETKLREKIQATKNDPSPTFYKMMSYNQKKKIIVDSCEVIDEEMGTRTELNDPAEIAGHIASVYAKIFNNEINSNMNDLLDFMDTDIDKIQGA